MVKLYIVRHCQTMSNQTQTFQGWGGSPLSDIGIFQLGLLSESLKDEKFDVIYSSPLDRAFKTAQAINVFHGVEIIQDDNLKEINVGDMAEMSCDEIPKIFPNESKIWNDEIYNFISPNGESMREVFTRTSKALKEIIIKNPDKNIVIVSHGCAIRTMLCYLSGFEIEKINEIPLGSNTAISTVSIDVDGVKIEKLSDDKHLPKLFRSDPKKAYKFKIDEVSI
ncbi:MAG: histidine phosphatase family protein [Clostridia bacterium]